MKHTSVSRIQDVDVAQYTGPLSAMAGRSVLVIADLENLVCGARDLGFALDHRALAGVLDRACRSCIKHAFFSRAPGDTRLADGLERVGWTSHPVDIQHVRSYRGTVRRANSDNTILFYAGHLASVGYSDMVILASGDGDLVSDAARCLRELRSDRCVATLSLAGSTSYRLDSRNNSDIAVNIEIGMDCLRPWSSGFSAAGQRA